MSMKILHIDIETAPNKVYAWGLFNQNVAINQIEEPGYTLCFAAQWEHKKKHIFKSIHHDSHEEMVKTAWELLNEADTVVHYNGKSFDIPTLNREFILEGLLPPKDYFQVDLYRVVRSNFRFASNKLDYVAQQLGLGSKISHKGMELWRACMAGDDDAWKIMKKYNIQDVKLMLPLYERLLPWVKSHPNHGLFIEDNNEPVCRNCGGRHLQRRGTRKTSVTEYPRFQCMDCGSWQRGRGQAKRTGAGVMI
jgi:DNA polymerase elongation subunit (family B)